MYIGKMDGGVLFVAGVLVVLSSIFVNAQPTYTEYKLNEGKNIVTFYESSFAVEVLGKHPEIESISYFDVRLNNTVGYVRAFGGIGKNFLIVPGQPYEIFVNQNISLLL